MMKMTEAQFQKKVEEYLKKQKCWFVKYWGGGAYTKAGVPDLLVCCNGVFIGIELKASTGHPSELQIYNIEKIRKAGGMAFVLYPEQFDLFDQTINLLRSNFVESAYKNQFNFWLKKKGMK